MKTSPNGFWINGEGHHVPESMIQPIDRERESLVRELVGKAQEMSALLATFKGRVFADVAAFVELSCEQYGAKIGGKKGNVTLVSYDGRYKIVRQVQDSIVFDERLQAAKQLIDDCVRDWGKGADDKILVLVNDAFQVGKEGLINTGRVLGLRRLNITDDKWLAAMQAIGDSVRVSASKPYVRFYERVGDTDQYKPISLDMAAV